MNLQRELEMLCLRPAEAEVEDVDAASGWSPMPFGKQQARVPPIRLVLEDVVEDEPLDFAA